MYLKYQVVVIQHYYDNICCYFLPFIHFLLYITQVSGTGIGEHAYKQLYTVLFNIAQLNKDY